MLRIKDFVGRLGVSLPMGLSLGGYFYIGKKPGMADGELTGNDVTNYPLLETYTAGIAYWLFPLESFHFWILATLMLLSRILPPLN